MMGLKQLIGLRAFLVWVLSSHCVRILVLNLTILDEPLFRNAGAITTNIFQRAVPNLQYFRIVWASCCDFQPLVCPFCESRSMLGTISWDGAPI
jgi:hypothetical protein